MNAEKLEVIHQIFPDIVILDSEKRIVLLAQVKGKGQKQGNTSEVISWLKAGNGSIPFTMFIDLKNIHVFKWNSTHLLEPVCTLNTFAVFGHYGLETSDKYIFSRYLSSKAESWLSDLGYYWKSPTPPALEEIAAIGLLPLLQDGTRQPEVEIRIDPKLKYIVLRYYSPISDNIS